MDKIAFVFPGQGAQYTGMGKELYETSVAAKDIFEKAEEVMPGLKSLCFEGGDALNDTLNTQPCLFTVDMAAACALAEQGIKPAMAAGFSLGELAALAFSGMLSFEEALKLVIKRGSLMQACAAKNPGVMAAVLKLAAAQVEEIAKGFVNVYPVNYNSPEQTVVAMQKEQFEAFASAVKAQKGRVVKLNVSGAFHSPFMQEAGEKLWEEAKKYNFKKPAIPIYANATGEEYPSDVAMMLKRQVQSPVKWQQTVENMSKAGCNIFIETGAGKTLSGLIKKINTSLIVYHVQDKESLASTIDAVKGETSC